MENSLNFLIEVNKLKEIPRTGWVSRGVKNPETIADHTFRIAFAAWLLSCGKKLNAKRMLKIAISHDLCEIYAGDNTPFFYYQNLDKKKIKNKEVFLKWVRLSRREKEKRSRHKFNIEKKSMLRLVASLRPGIKNEIFSAWLDFENKLSREGRFVRQVDRIETLLQAIEYLGVKKNIAGTAWWEEIEEIIEDPMLISFLHIIQNKFYKKHFPRDKKLENILDFLISIGQLKRMSRLYWTLRGVKRPETVAGHIFTLSLMTLIFGKEKRQLDMGKLLKMALCHEITAVYTKDTVPYYENLPKDKEKRKEIFKTLPRLAKGAKMRKFAQDYKLEGKAIRKVVAKLEPATRKEIVQLWEEYRNRSSLEGNLLSQLNVIAVLLQALLYKKENKNFSVQAVWEWAFEICDDVVCCKLLDEIKKNSSYI